jgi:hypothetical protein
LKKNKERKMKKLLTTLIISLVSLVSTAQLVTTQPDTVCFGSTTPSTYTIPSVGSGTYTWTISGGGSIVSGQGTNTINVNWSSAPAGLITNGVSVSYTSPAPANCPSTPVNLNVLIYQVTPTITAIGPFCESDPCVNLVGTPAGGTWTGTGVVGNQFCPDNVTNGTNSTSTVTYTVNSAGCTFTTSVVVPVYGTPTLQPIQH